MEIIKLAIVEDNMSAQRALKEKLNDFPDIGIQFVAANGLEMLQLLQSDASVNMILMDIQMPVMNGIEATRLIKKEYPHIKIVMITIYDDDDSIFNAIKAGADSYILKETKADKVYETIIDTMNGGAVMSPSIAAKALRVLKEYNNAVPANQLKPQEDVLSLREKEILENLSTGLTNKQIAEILYISSFTVKRHIENIYRKLQAQNRTELLSKAKNKGWI
ncbi:response regulator transcription factor [Sediminibacterium sp. C3]|uniref:response regulator transcription factor n=1 Tax=Sediminibacterium sp. C3 TaxID=1267211 RepID=UPI0004278FF1|nr:response regulator transcription factor [Sediminibacterium sp. C3]